MGGRIWVDKRVLLRHSGSYVFCMENQDHLFNHIGPMFAQSMSQQGKINVVDTSVLNIPYVATPDANPAVAGLAQAAAADVNAPKKSKKK